MRDIGISIELLNIIKTVKEDEHSVQILKLKKIPKDVQEEEGIICLKIIRVLAFTWMFKVRC